jgi:hypothetical protein
MSNIRQILLRHIRQDGGTQARARMDDATIGEYAEAMVSGVTFPPVVVFEDHISNFLWLGDGFHRVKAAFLAGKKNIKAEVRPGGLREAQLFAIGANATHGVRRSNADKRMAVSLLLDDPEWGAWSNREIASTAGVSHQFVNVMRSERVATVATPAPKDPQRKEEAMPPASGKPAPAAAPLPPLPDDLLQFDTRDEEDAGDTFGKRLEALAKKFGAEATDELFDAWSAAWDADHRDAFIRLLVAEALPVTFEVPGDEERDEWLSGFAPVPKPDSTTWSEMERGATEQVCGVPEATRPVSPYVDEAKLHPAEPPASVLKAAPLPPGPDDRDSRIVQLEHLVEVKDKEIAELGRKLEEAGAQVQELAEENATMHRVLDAEDLLAKFKEEVVRAQALARTTEERFRGMQNQNKALAKSAESWKGKFDRLQKKVKGAPVPDPDPEIEAESPYPPVEV